MAANRSVPLGDGGSEVSLKEVTQRLLAFRDARDWKRFHSPKDLAVALTIEAAELLEHFRWMTDAEVKAHLEAERDAVADEVADVAAFLVYLTDALGLDLVEVLHRKIDRNEIRYPEDRARGVHTKYSRLHR